MSRVEALPKPEPVLPTLPEQELADRGNPAKRTVKKNVARHTAKGTAVVTGNRKAAPAPKPSAPPARVSLNLGIDFGTSFTKVCFRDVGTEESGVVTFGSRTAENAVIPTIVAVDHKGRLYVGDDIPRGVKVTAIPYLKMRLAGEPIDDTQTVAGYDLKARHVICALTSWFLASVIKRSQAWIDEHEKDRLKNRTPVWSANVGVPVEHFDSDALLTFKEALGVAWYWLNKDRLPSNIADAVAAYGQTVPALCDTVTDFHAVPEIAAAVQSFITSREASPGIYVYFDVGGGTLDGVAFNFINRNGERRINFYSGKVSTLGLAAIGAVVGLDISRPIEATSFDKHFTNGAQALSDEQAQRVRRFVAEVIMTAKRKDGRDWQRDAIQRSDSERKNVGPLLASRMQPLRVFVGGGGSQSTWYCTAITSTYVRFKHHNAGIPPYELREVPRPADLNMYGLADQEFRRFAISYGLSIPFGEGPDLGLPSQFTDAEKPRQWQPSGVVDYADSKDLC
ncbi:hypothetical protein [Phyllobacterium endophyticum]|uniref:hypothetical protein n=1 Tax=Phyllobacterium endophyticum TaxID=1149773 RepID=UPI0011CC5516|nr:hypothetical protein [Phyllobacterium endophyticum]TXR47500.1 hypothetical protein FVA77_19420 [Phyllobacterium endophyticum]